MCLGRGGEGGGVRVEVGRGVDGVGVHVMEGVLRIGGYGGVMWEGWQGMRGRGCRRVRGGSSGRGRLRK